MENENLLREVVDQYCNFWLNKDLQTELFLKTDKRKTTKLLDRLGYIYTYKRNYKSGWSDLMIKKKRVKQ